MKAIHKSQPLAVHTWDWKTQPEWHFIQSVISNFLGRHGYGIYIEEVETGNDEYAIVISKNEIGGTEVYQHYVDAINDETGNWKHI